MRYATKFTDKIIFDAEVSERKILVIPANSIKHTPYNPPSRTKDGIKFQKLAESIKRYGLQQPILITADRDIVDGNRRLAACISVGKSRVECIITTTDDKDDLFGTLNDNTLPINGKGWLSIARTGGMPPPKERAQYDELNKLIGNYGVDLLIQNNLGLNMLPFCKSISAMGSTKQLAEIIITVASRKLVNKINFELRADKSREEKVSAIDAMLDAK